MGLVCRQLGQNERRATKGARTVCLFLLLPVSVCLNETSPAEQNGSYSTQFEFARTQTLARLRIQEHLGPPWLSRINDFGQIWSLINCIFHQKVHGLSRQNSLEVRCSKCLLNLDSHLNSNIALKPFYFFFLFENENWGWKIRSDSSVETVVKY